jgi:hypothetical protein
MQAEVEFLRFAGELAQKFVPQLIAVDWKRRCVLLEHLPGETYREGYVPTAADLELACEFVRRINGDREKAEKFITMNAAEGYIRLTEHLENVSERIKDMSVSHLPSYYQKQAEKLIEKVQSRIKLMADQTMKRIQSGELNDAVDRTHLCISPSDFGFHNAIRNECSIKFFDFEFSGWDDPSKLIADFVLQPRVPIENLPNQLVSIFQPDVAKVISERCSTLGPILRIKWLCIILSVLNPKRLNQIIEIHKDIIVDNLVKQRLESATNYLNKRTPFGLH